MTAISEFKNRRITDPYLDRRSGEDRREVHSIHFFANGGTERRKQRGRRNAVERRKGCTRVSEWSSVCVAPKREMLGN